MFPFFDGNRNVGGALVDDKKSEGHLDLEIGISLLLKLSHCFYAIAIHADKTNNAIAPWDVQKRSTQILF